MAISNGVSLGQPVPKRPHAVSVHMKSWDNVVRFGLGEKKILELLKSGYPRSFLHPSLKILFNLCAKNIKEQQGDISLVLFLDEGIASSCKEFMLYFSHKNNNRVSGDAISIASVEINSLNGPDKTLELLHAVIFPKEVFDLAASFWRLTGTGISSRLADDVLQNRGIKISTCTQIIKEQRQDISGHPVFVKLRSRIAALVERTPLNCSRDKRVSKSDVFLYPSGMSAIYHVHQALLAWRQGDSAILGFTYEVTIKMLDTYGPGCHFYGLGTEEDLDKLEKDLENRGPQNRQMQALWCECPSNPLLKTVNLRRAKQLANQYDLVMIVDDTIGSFANVNVLDVADIVVSSLTKYFNGFGDVLAGSVILNPNSIYFAHLHSALSDSHVNRLYVGDAVQLELNSRSYLSRVARVNDTALYLVNKLIPYVNHPSSSVRWVYYPSVSRSRDNYNCQMRPETDDFKPGYGGLFTVEFETTASAACFFDKLQFCKGPSFGTDVTIALPYVQMVLQKEKEWAEKNGLRETIVRVAVGLEDKKELWMLIEDALAT